MNQVSEKTMAFADEMYNLIKDSSKDMSEFKPELQAAIYAINVMEREDAVGEIAAVCDGWLAANPGEYPYIRLFDAFGIAPSQTVCDLAEESSDLGWLSEFTGADVTVTDANVMGYLENSYDDFLIENMFLTVSDMNRYFDEYDSDDDKWFRIIEKIRDEKDIDPAEYMYFRVELDKRYIKENSEFDNVRRAEWTDIWAAFCDLERRNSGDSISAYEFLTKYCEVRPAENEK